MQGIFEDITLLVFLGCTQARISRFFSQESLSWRAEFKELALK
jgi:hypothetical protein